MRVTDEPFPPLDAEIGELTIFSTRPLKGGPGGELYTLDLGGGGQPRCEYRMLRGQRAPSGRIARVPLRAPAILSNQRSSDP